MEMLSALQTLCEGNLLMGFPQKEQLCVVLFDFGLVVNLNNLSNQTNSRFATAQHKALSTFISMQNIHLCRNLRYCNIIICNNVSRRLERVIVVHDITSNWAGYFSMKLLIMLYPMYYFFISSFISSQTPSKSWKIIANKFIGIAI